MSQTAIPAQRANATPVTNAPAGPTIYPGDDILSKGHPARPQGGVTAGQSDSSGPVSIMGGNGQVGI